jgi:Rrf2 family protein
VLQSKSATYAVLVVLDVARNQQNRSDGISSSELVRRLRLPAAYAQKIMSRLVRAGILHSDRGPRGGFRVLRPPESITLLDIIDAIDGRAPAEPAWPRLRGVAAARDALRNIYISCREQLRDELRKHSLAGLLRANGAQKSAGSDANKNQTSVDDAIVN